MFDVLMSDEAILKELGDRLKQERLNQNLSQDELAEAAGLGRRTITNIENGHGGTLTTFVGMLRALDKLNHLDLFLPPNTISPIALADNNGLYRQRATGKRKTLDVKEDAGEWTWGDE